MNEMHQPPGSQQKKKHMFLTRNIITGSSMLFILLILIIFALTQKRISKTFVPSSKITQPPAKAEIVSGEIVVKFHHGLSNEQIDQVIQKYHAKRQGRIPAIKRIILKVQPGK